MDVMAVWTKAKLEEALDLGSNVLGGSNPLTATNFGVIMYNGNTPDLQSGNRGSIPRGSTTLNFNQGGWNGGGRSTPLVWRRT